MFTHEYNVAQQLWQTGNMLRQQGKVDEAGHAYQQAIYACPEFAQAHFSLAVLAFYDKKNPEKAITEYRLAIQFKPEWGVPYYNLALVFMSMQDYDQAILVLKRLIDILPNFVAAYLSLGNIWESLGEMENAIIVYRKAIDLWPNFTEAQQALGECLLRQGHTQEGLHTLSMLADKHPNFSEVHMSYALALHSIGQENLAKQEWQRVVDIVDELSEENIALEQDHVLAAEASSRLALLASES